MHWVLLLSILLNKLSIRFDGAPYLWILSGVVSSALLLSCVSARPPGSAFMNGWSSGTGASTVSVAAFPFLSLFNLLKNSRPYMHDKKNIIIINQNYTRIFKNVRAITMRNLNLKKSGQHLSIWIESLFLQL